MHRKKLLVILCLFVAAVIPLGCWDYRGLNQINIVTGMAIDMDETTGQYLITFEVADLSGNVAQQGAKSKIIQAEGRTVFDATRNATLRTEHKLYFGDMQTVIISNYIATHQNIGGIIQWFLAEYECRDTVCLAVSMEQTAGGILMLEDEQKSIKAFDLYQIITEDSQHAISAASGIMLYKIYAIINAQGIMLTLPLLHQSTNTGKPVNELCGTAVYKMEKMVGTLNPEESKYFLFASDQVKGGMLTLPLCGEEIYDISLEIAKNSTSVSYREVGGDIVMHIKTDSDVSLGESRLNIDMSSATQIKALEDAAAEIIETNIQKVVKKVQTEYNSDIFGFGSVISKANFKRWKQLAPQWDALFPNLLVEVDSKVHIMNSAFIETKGK